MVKLQCPCPQRFVRELNASGRQHFLHDVQTQRKAKVQPYRVADHLGRETVASVGN